MLIELPDVDFAGTVAGTRRLGSLAEVRADRVGAHESLFSHRHPLATCEAQRQAILDLHGPAPRIIVKAFRGFAKSTLAEEAVTIQAGLEEWCYGVILGNTVSSAMQRLASIKREINQNTRLMDIFGDLRGPIWREGYIELSSGVSLHAWGARQSMRGAKQVTRPDFVLIDDLEDLEWVRSAEAIEQNSIWFFSEFLPALADSLRTPIRWIGTPLAENCLLNQMAASGDFLEHIYPVKHLDLETGEWLPTWEAKYSLADIDKLEENYTKTGRHREFVQEYMCESDSKTEVLFTKDMFHYRPEKPRVWQGLYGMIDPARTTKKKSAMTGWAVWSWDGGGRLTIWEAGGAYLKPDEIIKLMFDLHGRWGLIELGIEEDGLNEWATQPIRDMQVKRGTIPFRAMRAPHGKIDFIKGLQPYFKANTVTLVGTPDAFAVLTEQLLSFPRLLIDVPNALAYALMMRAGELVYPDFSPENITETEEIVEDEPIYLAMNADGQWVTAALVQVVRGSVRVLADYVAEGTPGDVAGDVVRKAVLATGRKVKAVIGPIHGEKYRNFGLVQALIRAGAPGVFGADPAKIGRALLRDALQKRLRGSAGFMVASVAGWTLRGLTGGYCFPIGSGNVMASEPQRGAYRTLIEGLESFVGLAALSSSDDDDSEPGSWAYTKDGRRYRSALRTRQ